MIKYYCTTTKGQKVAENLIINLKMEDKNSLV